MKLIIITEKDTIDQDYFYNHIVQIEDEVNVADILKRADELNSTRLDDIEELENPTMCLEKAIEEFGGEELSYFQEEWYA